VISLSSNLILHSNRTISEIINGVKIIRLPEQYWTYSKRIREVLNRFYLSNMVSKLDQENHFDVIEGEDGRGMLALGRLPDIPKIVRLHASQIFNDHVLNRKPSRLDHIFEKIWIRRANFIIAVSDYVGWTTLQLIEGQSKRDYKVIHYAIDTDFFKPTPLARTETGLIVFTGAVAPRKGVLPLMEAMNIVFEKNEAAHLRIIGDIPIPLEVDHFLNKSSNVWTRSITTELYLPEFNQGARFRQ